MLLRVRKAVRQLKLTDAEGVDLSGADNEADWQAMMYQIHQRDREIERRLERAERALNQLDFR